MGFVLCLNISQTSVSKQSKEVDINRKKVNNLRIRLEVNEIPNFIPNENIKEANRNLPENIDGSQEILYIL